MKKSTLIILVAIVLTLAVVATACNNLGGNDTYDTLNKMLKDDFSVIKLEVETTYQDVTLTNKYTATTVNGKTSIRYTLQTLSEITKDEDGKYVIPELTTTKTGKADFVNGKLTNIDGDAEDVPIDAITSPSLKFDKSYFMSTIHSENDGVKTITGTVIQDRIKDFTGNQNFDGENMTFTVTYGEKLQSLVINYTMSSGSSVKVTYTFS